MAFLNDNNLDAALSASLGAVNRLDICTQEPTTFTEATSTYTMYANTSWSFLTILDGDPDGRMVFSVAEMGVTPDSNGTATHWALTDGTNLVATGALAAPVALTTLDTFSYPAFEITFRDLILV